MPFIAAPEDSPNVLPNLFYNSSWTSYNMDIDSLAELGSTYIPL